VARSGKRFGGLEVDRHLRHFATQQNCPLFDHLGGTHELSELLCGLDLERLRDRGELVADLLDTGGEFGWATDVDDLAGRR
jgi:hypothetical protein